MSIVTNCQMATKVRLKHSHVDSHPHKKQEESNPEKIKRFKTHLEHPVVYLWLCLCSPDSRDSALTLSAPAFLEEQASSKIRRGKSSILLLVSISIFYSFSSRTHPYQPRAPRISLSLSLSRSLSLSCLFILEILRVFLSPLLYFQPFALASEFSLPFFQFRDGKHWSLARSIWGRRSALSLWSSHLQQRCQLGRLLKRRATLVPRQRLLRVLQRGFQYCLYFFSYSKQEHHFLWQTHPLQRTARPGKGPRHPANWNEERRLSPMEITLFQQEKRIFELWLFRWESVGACTCDEVEVVSVPVWDGGASHGDGAERYQDKAEPAEEPIVDDRWMRRNGKRQQCEEEREGVVEASKYTPRVHG